MPRKRLLFVDDEPQVLSLLQSMFRHVSPDWDSVVTIRSPEALSLMATEPFDVVVSDMQMPQMNGAQLLERVRDQYPRTTRVVLSGYPDQALSIQALGAAHQYLAKPFRVGDLQGVVARADQLDGRVADPALRAGLSRLSALPAVPSIWQRFEREMASPTVSVESLGGLIGQDPALTLKILQSVHSAFFGAPSRVLLAKEAAHKLGGGLLRAATHAKRLVAPPAEPMAAGLSLERIAKYSVATGLHASRILSAERALPDVVKLGFTGGVLHEIGQIALAMAAPEAYAEVVRRVMAGGTSLLEAERAALGTDHAGAGAYLLGLWGLPQAWVDLVAHHHRPSAEGNRGITPMTAVHLASHAQRQLAGWPEGANGELDEDYLRTMPVDAERIDYWMSLGTDAKESD
jgi:HD-like signal output (HDOD) protein/CheY-like chemotaxis protein